MDMAVAHRKGKQRGSDVGWEVGRWWLLGAAGGLLLHQVSLI